MEQNIEGEARHLDLVGALTLQNQLFLERLGGDISVTLHNTLSEALSLIGLRAEGMSVLLLDTSHIPLERILEELGAVQLHDNVCPALLNLDRGASCMAGTIALGVRGVFFRDGSIDLVLRGVRALFEGSVWISRETLYEAVRSGDHYRHHNDTPERQERSQPEELTRREKEIVGLICIGATNQEIADKLFISTNTVKTHIYKVYKKIRVPNRMQAALWGAKNL